MDAFLNNFVANPMLYISDVFLAVAVVVFLIYLGGLAIGIEHFFTISGRDDFLKESRFQAVWGVYMLAVIFVIWEIVRFIAYVVAGAYNGIF